MTWSPWYLLAVAVVEASIVVGAWLSDAPVAAIVAAAAFVILDAGVWLVVGRSAA